MKPSSLVAAYKLRLKRKRLLWRAFRKRRDCKPHVDRTQKIAPNDIIVFATVRNEAHRLVYFLEHYRALGVSHFIFVANDCTDDTVALLGREPDVSVWTTNASYRESRFGVDWLSWLLRKFGSGHWCLTLDADELLVLPENTDLPTLTAWMTENDAPAVGTTMIDMYPKTRLSAVQYKPGSNPIDHLSWFDADGYTTVFQQKYGNFSIRGGIRKRKFFLDRPEHAPHLQKIPLVFWHRSYVYVSSTHVLLPRHLNSAFDPHRNLPTGALLHTKFLDSVLAASAEEKERRQHFTHAERYDGYYDWVISDPILWDEHSTFYKDATQLQTLGIMQKGHFSA